MFELFESGLDRFSANRSKSVNLEINKKLTLRFELQQSTLRILSTWKMQFLKKLKMFEVRLISIESDRIFEKRGSKASKMDKIKFESARLKSRISFGRNFVIFNGVLHVILKVAGH